MFLSHQPNPHHGGRPTRALFLDTAPGTRFAIDAETLHRQPQRLRALGPNYTLWMRGLDAAACLVAVAGVLAATMIGWWIAVWSLGVCAWMIAANRRTAGRIARSAARRSPDSFRALHEMGCLWLAPAER